MNNKRLTVLLVVSLVMATLGCAYYFRLDLYQLAVQAEAKKAGFHQQQLIVDDLSIQYFDTLTANKPILLLVHGFGAQKENWLRFAQALKGEYRILALDLPGHGGSDLSLAGRYDIASQVDFLQAFTQALPINSFHLAGNSMGGQIGATFAANYPDKVLSLSLLSPGGIIDIASEFHRQVAQGKNTLIVSDEVTIKDVMKVAMEQVPFIPWPLLIAANDLAKQREAINREIYRQLLAAPDLNFRQKLLSIKAPTLILWGEKDRVIDSGNAKFFKQLIPNSELILMPEVGHAPMMEIPQQSAQMLQRFIEAH